MNVTRKDGELVGFELNISKCEGYVIHSQEVVSVLKDTLAEFFEGNSSANRATGSFSARICLDQSLCDVDGLVALALSKSATQVEKIKMLREAILRNANDDVLRYSADICGLKC